jgi:hypothetical protein
MAAECATTGCFDVCYCDNKEIMSDHLSQFLQEVERECEEEVMERFDVYAVGVKETEKLCGVAELFSGT